MRRPLLALCGIVLATLLTPGAQAEEYARFHKDPEAQARFIKQKITEHFPTRAPDLLAIAECESAGLIHWLSDGRLIPNEQGASSAAGVFQVTLDGHQEAIEAHGLNMQDIDDYLTFVGILVEGRPNYEDWAASRRCWRKKIGRTKVATR